jgi:ElaB/YqjD/DUF883 family membrane-anchored ribosome-binding protein
MPPLIGIDARFDSQRLREKSPITPKEANVTSPASTDTGSTERIPEGNQARANSEPNADVRTDDVSFARRMGVDQSADAKEKAGNMVERAQDGAKDAMNKLQSKASDLTSQMMDRINVEDLTQKLEEQVREHPARTLMIAAGAGFLLGRAAKK